MALRIKRGNTTQRLATTPVDGELVFDTTENKIYVGKNNTAGGVPVVSGVIGGLVSTNIDLNGKDITGTGNINITGTITASGTITGNGDLVLGNAATDNVQFGADINSNIVPNTGSLTLGTTGQPWQTVYAGAIENAAGITINSNLALNGNIATNTIVPSSDRTKDLGSLSTRWKGVYAESMSAGSVTISGNDIVVADSNANINIVPSGSGSLVTNRISASASILVGTSTITKIEGGLNPGDPNSIHFFYNGGTNSGKIVESGQLGSYTQLVTNAAESFTIGSGLVTEDTREVKLVVTTPSGTQLIVFVYQLVAGTGQITVLSNTWTGTKPINLVALRSGSQTIIDLTTNTTAVAGTVYDIKTRTTTFLNT